MLAEAFCLSDEQVRSAQTALDEAQAHRSRLLAAFAVTVGSDGAVAGVLGLHEREVRVARRTVGKEDARGVADELLASNLSTSSDEQQDPVAAETPAAVPGMAAPAAEAPVAPDPHHEQQALYQQHQQAQQQVHHQQAQQAQQAQQVQQQLQHQQAQQHTAREPRWTGAMDALLVGSWQTGVDLQVLAAEFGLDLARLVARAQQLSAEGRLSPPWAAAGPSGETRSGRHRRNTDGTTDYGYDFYDSYGSSPYTGSWEVPSTVPDDMLTAMPHQPGWPQYTHSGVS
ncbi:MULTISPECIES: hypothetical protein [Streptomyces]|uniref:hypothetical protein n=1 Tax=Streptomyces TaxID=1883 RepID=UPI001F21FA3D|nr:MULTISPECIES: hypothetical protein [Streptomyces]